MSEKETSIQEDEESSDYLTVTIAGQRFGIPVLQVQDVLREQTVTRIPLAPKEVAGSLNLRGRIVTAIDVRKRLGLSAKNDNRPSMSVVVEYSGELFSLIIDSVGDVLRFKNQYYESNPGTLDPLWRDISKGIYQLEEELLVIMDVSRLLEGVGKQG
ncbi:MAG: chemotaxis protein CheW [Alphaproteobacteria bacterium]